MPTLPSTIIANFSAFMFLFSPRVYAHVQMLLIGTILTTGKRTVASVLRTMGKSHDRHFQNYHRVLNRARWSSRVASLILLRQLIAVFAPHGPLIFGGDETLERRRGKKIAAKGIYRDAARSSKSAFVKSSGLRWIVLSLLAPVPWADKVWALPFFCVLAPSERYHQERKRRHKTITHWMRQMLAQVRRWLPERDLVFVADSTYSALALLDWCRNHRITVITRLRLDAALFEPAPERKAHQIGRPPKKGKRLPKLEKVLANPKTQWTTVTVPRWYSQGERTVEIVTGTAVWYHPGMPVVPIRFVLIRDPEGKFEPQALLCTDLAVEPVQIMSWFVLRWQMETTFQEVRRHLGVETQRQWNDLAIARTTPALMGIFSLITLMAHPAMQEADQTKKPFTRQAAWYQKEKPTFSDAIALVRRELWKQRLFTMSDNEPDIKKVQREFITQLTEALSYAV